ncbi:hypothetical protein P4C99_15175 [Pontiellaceae bacterium B1224]|nr:hypothetical protein [Pontiellaceae bacterium B1224]
MQRLCVRVICLLLALCASARSEPVKQAIQQRFQATKQGVELTYQISYHVFGIKLLRIGEARAYSVEGIWLNDDGEPVPAFYSEVRFDTRDEPGTEDRGRISIHNKMVAVMSNPELKTMVYFKDADEYLNPFFKGPKHEFYLDYYSIKEGGIDYFRKDYTTGEKTTELENADELLQQSNAIAATLRRMSNVYLGHEGALTHDSDFRVYFNVAGEVKPFAAESSKERFKVKPIDRKMEALRVDISLAPEAEGEAGDLTLWGVPFSELASTSGETNLIQLAADSPDWSMIPLRMNYKRPVGYIRCHLETIEGRSFDGPSKVSAR